MPTNSAGRMAKYLATSLAMEKVVSAAGDQQLLAHLDHVEQLGRVAVQVDQVGRPRAAWVPSFMAMPTSA